MKDLQTLFAEMQSDPALQEKFFQAADINEIMAIIKENDCNATQEEVEAFMKQMGM